MITVSAIGRRPRDASRLLPSAGSRLLARTVVIALAGAHALGCAKPVVQSGPSASQGGAILAALEHVAESKWGQPGTIMVRGQLAVKYGGEDVLSESTRTFLDGAFAARGWRWSTEDPLVPTGNCVFPSGDCQLKNPTELHLTFQLVPAAEEGGCAAERSGPPRFNSLCWEPVAGEERHGISVGWLSSYYSEGRGRTQAVLGSDGLLVTGGPEGWVIEVRIKSIT